MQQLTGALFIRAIAVIIPLFLVVNIPQLEVSLLFVCFGLAHLALAFWYQRDAKKWNPRKYALTVAAFFALLFIGLNVSFTTVVLTLATLFGLHFVLDEPFFFKKKHSVYTTLEAMPFLILYTGLMIDTFVGTSLFVGSVVLALLAVGANVVVIASKKRSPDIVTGVYVFWGVVALLAYAAFALLPIALAPQLWFLLLTMVHYVMWYAEFWKKVKGDVQRRTVYVWRSIGVNAFFLGFCYVWHIGMAPFGIIFYAPLFFYIWSFLHVSTSLRVGEIRSSLKFS